MYQVKVSNNARLSKVQQIVNALVKDIETGRLKADQKLPSINQFSDENRVARDTVEKAYQQLKKRGYIASFPARGYFVLANWKKQKKVLLIFNKLSSFKKIIYENLLKSLGTKAKVDLQIHHYDPRLLKEILEEHLGNYDYYAIMPHFFSGASDKDFLDIIKKVPAHQLIILDKSLPQLTFAHRAICQDFKEDIYQALHSLAPSLKKYKSITLVLPGDIHHPPEIATGIKAFCQDKKLKFHHVENVAEGALRKHTVYILTEEDELANLLKKVRRSDCIPGKDIGIISFNETVFKELLDITVISTDFAQMGRTAAKLILGNEYEQCKNPFVVIPRGSL